MRKFAALCCSMFMLTLAANAARAEDAIPPSPIVKAALAIDAPMVQQDGIVWAGVTFTIPDHWHIYWQNPGDSGIPTTLTWTLPEGLTAGDITWPAPERLEVSGLVNYGYSHQVTLPVPLTAARDNLKGKISVKANWLVCRDVCIPEHAVLEGSIPSETEGAKQLLENAIMRAPQFAIHAITHYSVSGSDVTLTVTGKDVLPEGVTAPITKAYFFPQEDGIIANAEPQQFTLSNDGTTLTLMLKRGQQDAAKLWHGVLQFEREGKTYSYNLAAELQGEVPPATAVAVPPAPVTDVPLYTALALAFLGGLILNIMPCVLPILALKALAITKKAQLSRKAAAHQGLAYTVGVLVSFLVIAVVMLSLKASGAAIGWGFQLQNVEFVGILAAVMLLVAANLLGLFQLPVLFGERATKTNDEKLTGSFFTGVLAVLVATPCTAPFMATAIGATLAFPTLYALFVFTALGLGMAFPFLLISFWPAARKLLPKPGAWMHRFKQILAIPMLATAAWLVWVLVQLTNATPVKMDAAHTPYSATALQQLREAGTPVLVDATAAWCLTCKVNERVALSSPSMQQFLKEKNVTLMVADWTSNDAAITAYLASHGRNGVPLYVYYGPHAEPVVLPQILTPAIVRGAISGEHE